MSDAYIRRSAAIDLIRRHIGDLQTSREQSLIAWVISSLRTMPAADVVQVVYCRYCTYCVRAVCTLDGLEGLRAVEPYDFCSYGRKEDHNDT